MTKAERIVESREPAINLLGDLGKTRARDGGKHACRQSWERFAEAPVPAAGKPMPPSRLPTPSIPLSEFASS